MNIIQNKTKITKKDILKFLNRASLQNLWIVSISAIVVALLGFTIENGSLIYKNFFFLIAGVLVFIIYFVVIAFTLRKQTKNFKEIENEYFFNDEGISVIGSTNGETEKFDMKYHNLFKVKETKDSYYFFVNNYSALILSKDKTCFSHGNAERLQKLLSLKLNPKQNQLKKTK